MRNRSFCGARRARNAPKESPKGVQKRTPQKTRTSHFLGVRFGSFFGSLDASWAYLGALCCYLVASWPQRPTKGGPREVKRGSRGTQEPPKRGPRAAQESRGESKMFRRAKERPKRAADSPKRAQDRPREFQREPKTATEPRLQRGGSGGILPPALYKQGRDHLALRRASLFIVLFASVFAILLVFAVLCLLLRRAVCCALHCLAVLRCTDLRCTSYGSLRCSCFAASLKHLFLSFAKYTNLCHIYIYVLVAVLSNSYEAFL